MSSTIEVKCIRLKCDSCAKISHCVCKKRDLKKKKRSKNIKTAYLFFYMKAQIVCQQILNERIVKAKNVKEKTGNRVF